MSFGIIALLLAGLGAGWLLLRLARGGEETKNVTLLKLVVWLGLAAALFAARLWPLAFMVLVAAGGVMAIEAWKNKTIAEDKRANSTPVAPQKTMTEDEALAVLGLSQATDAEKIKAAHKKLISQIHPDKGGTDYLAAKINEARDILLDRIETGR